MQGTRVQSSCLEYERIEEFMEQGGRTVAKSKAIAEELTEQGCRAVA